MDLLELVIFDMDGLMFDTEKILLEAWVKTGEDSGYPITKEIILETIGRNVVDTELIYKRYFGDNFPYKELYEKTHICVDNIIEKKGVPIKEGLLELLKHLDKKGFKKAVATSNSRDKVKKLLSNANIIDRFDYVLCGDEISRGKPEPEIFLTVCEKLDIHPNNALVIEDSEMGLLASYKAGIKCILVPDVKLPSKENEFLAYAKLKSLIEVMGII